MLKLYYSLNRSPPVGHFYFSFLVRKIPFAGIELTSRRVRVLRGTSELPGRPASCPLCLKKNQNAPRLFEHPPVRGEKMSKRLGGIKGWKYKTSSWHSNGFPDGNNIGSTV